MSFPRFSATIGFAIALGMAVPQMYTQGRSGYITDFYCNPSTCLYFSSPAPIVKSTMKAFATWHDYVDPTVTRFRGLIGTTTANCTNNVNVIMSADDTVYNDYLGEGVEVTSEAQQFGIDILNVSAQLFMYGSGGSGGSVPCS